MMGETFDKYVDAWTTRAADGTALPSFAGPQDSELCDDCGAKLTDNDLDLYATHEVDGTISCHCDECYRRAVAQSEADYQRYMGGVSYACGYDW